MQVLERGLVAHVVSNRIERLTKRSIVECLRGTGWGADDRQGNGAGAGDPPHRLQTDSGGDGPALKRPQPRRCKSVTKRIVQNAMKRGAKPLGDNATTSAERQPRFRQARADGAPKVRYHRPADRRSTRATTSRHRDGGLRMWTPACRSEPRWRRRSGQRESVVTRSETGV
jgi:hypothetical protein